AQPFGVVEIDSSTQSLRRDARHVAAVEERGAHDVVLTLNTPKARRHRNDVILELKLAAAEDGVSLRIECLPHGGVADAGAAGAGVRIAGVSAEGPEDKPVEPGVISGEFEAERSGGPPQSSLHRLRDLDREIGIALVEGGG